MNYVINIRVPLRFFCECLLSLLIRLQRRQRCAGQIKEGGTLEINHKDPARFAIPEHVRLPNVSMHNSHRVDGTHRPDQLLAPLLTYVLCKTALTHALPAPREEHHVDDTDLEVVVV